LHPGEKRCTSDPAEIKTERVLDLEARVTVARPTASPAQSFICSFDANIAALLSHSS
jgi:hypothetical protein